MPGKILKENLKKIILILHCFVFIFASYLLAADKVDKGKQPELEYLHQLARSYRLEGLQFQEAGDLDSAFTLYQKAVELDPTYSLVYNDLGVIYEALNQPDRAEESYLRAVGLDKSFLGAYTNLALLYESQRQLKKAAFFWQKRVELGSPDDPWTLKAQQRLEDIRLVLSGNPALDIRERDINDLAREVSAKLAGEKARE